MFIVYNQSQVSDQKGDKGFEVDLCESHWQPCSWILLSYYLSLLIYLLTRKITAQLYIPANCSFQDLLRCRVLTSGIIETRFQVDKVKFQ